MVKKSISSVYIRGKYNSNIFADSTQQFLQLFFKNGCGLRDRERNGEGGGRGKFLNIQRFL